MLQIFDLIKCEVCAYPWIEHNPVCPNHRVKYDRLEMLSVVMKGSSWPATEHMLRMNGYEGGPKPPT